LQRIPSTGYPRPQKKIKFRKLPLSPCITEEIAKSTDPATTQIAIESYGSYGKLFIYDLLKKGYDIREVNPHISKKLADLYSEEHSDQKDAESLAKALLFIPDLPRISITDKKQWLAKLKTNKKEAGKGSQWLFKSTPYCFNRRLWSGL